MENTCKEGINYCQCGCKQEVKSGNRFINGHNKYGHITGKINKIKNWELSVKQRDNYTCQYCGKANLKGRNCHSHHIKNKKEYPELKFVLGNGICLCISCHGFLHNIGKILSLETRQKQSIQRKGKSTGSKSLETRQKISASKMGSHRSLETRQKISNSLKGISRGLGVPWSKARREAYEERYHG